MKTEELIELQEEIELRKMQKAQLEGERSAIVKQLKEEFGCKSVKQAEQLIVENEEKRDSLDLQIADGLRELETSLKQIG